MGLAGLWHGANWTFVIFGAIHGAVLSVERYFFPVKAKSQSATLPALSSGFFFLWAQRILTFNVLGLSLAFFRATSLTSAVQLLAGLSHFSWRSEYAAAFLMLCIFTVPLFLTDLLLEASNQEYPFAASPYVVRTCLAAVALVVLALFSGSNLNAFVYFQF
jgi:D-alanyl-lipoteichoic acid acyltransferase DltB (MBOAT superfamily)